MPATTVDDVVLLGLEQLLQDDGKTCEILFAVGLRFRLFSRDVRLHTEPRPCGRTAAALVIARCPEHGPSRHPVCKSHLWLIKLGLRVGCYRCNRRTRYIGGG